MNTGKENLLEEVGRLNARKNPNANDKAEKKRVIGELNKGYRDGGPVMVNVTTKGQGKVMSGRKTKTYIC